MAMHKRLPIEKLKLEGTQTRAVLDSETLDAYTQLWKDGLDFPACVVFTDGKDYWVGGGHHRITAASRAKIEQVLCDVRQGGQREAIEFGFKDNDKHGLRRTNRDKEYSVGIALDDPEWSKMSVNFLADLCGVSRTIIERIRVERDPENPANTTAKQSNKRGDAFNASPTKRNTKKVTGKDGKKYDAKKDKPKPAPAVAAVEEEAKPPKQGSVKFDDRDLHKKLTAIGRLLDDRHKVYPDKAMHAACLHNYKALYDNLNSWREKNEIHIR